MPSVPQTRHSLLLELARQSDDAWVEFLDVYEDAILSFCRARGLQEADARDATQEVLAAVHERVLRGAPDGERGSFRAWLFRVARNVSVDALAERGRATAARGGEDGRIEALPDRELEEPVAFDAELQRALLARAAEQVRREVRDATWRAFHLTAVQGRSAEECAAELGVPVGTVYTAKCRVVARIREHVNRWSGEAPARPSGAQDGSASGADPR